MSDTPGLPFGALFCGLVQNLFRRDLGLQLTALWRLLSFHRAFFGALGRARGQLQVPEYFAEVVRKHGGKVAYRMAGYPSETADSWTYRQLDEYSNRVAHWAVEVAKLPLGETVALMAFNSPKFVGLWLGLAKAGCRAALINTNLSGKPLAHCLALAFEGNRGAVNVVVASPGLAPAVATAPRPASCVWCLTGNGACGGGADGATQPLAPLLESLPATPLDTDRRISRSSRDVLMYICTSGTTGLPKLARITHARFLVQAYAVTRFFPLAPGETLYSALPMYHSVGGNMAVGGAWELGGTLVLRPTFSASNFIADCRAHGATVALYVGELCRYVLKTPEAPADRDHKLRMVVGNGMRPDVWAAFTARFGVPRVGEFYGSTEGTANLFNFGLPEAPPGAVGYMPPLLRAIYPVRLFAIDQVTSELVRDAETGLCREAAPGERGECMGRITSAPNSSFEGYTNAAANAKKVAIGCVAPSDRWFRSGDLLRTDKHGWVYFCDRRGDNFRWKGENVATTEVEATLAGVRGVAEVNVYGVTVPMCDGRAGMAALVIDGRPESFDFGGVYKAALGLPSYARPLFLRVVPDVEVTGTLKHKKVALRDQGFDPAAIADRLLFRDDAKRAFVPLDEALHRKICAGKVRI